MTVTCTPLPTPYKATALVRPIGPAGPPLARDSVSIRRLPEKSVGQAQRLDPRMQLTASANVLRFAVGIPPR